MAGISDELRATLSQVFILGFLDASAGTPCPRTYPPPAQDHTPPAEHTPPAGHTPLVEHTPPGGAYPLPGEQAPLPGDNPPLLIALAEAAIDGSVKMIAELYPENPQTVYQTLYQVGFDTGVMLSPAEFNLN